MASSELIRAVVRSIIGDLKARRTSFGDQQIRSQSYYAQVLEAYGPGEGEARFTRYVWDRAVTLGIVPSEAERIEDDFNDARLYPEPGERPGLAADALLKQYPACRTELEAVTNYVDLYALWVESLKLAPNPAEAPEDLTSALTAWARCRLPSDCLQQTGLRAAVDHLLTTLREKVAEYRFDQDFLISWMVPTLAGAVNELLGGCRPDLTPDLRDRLLEEAGRIVEALGDSCGIYDLDAGGLVDRVLFFVITSEPAEYNERKPQMYRWAREKLKETIRLEAFFCCQPRMDMRDRWGQATTQGQKRVEAGELKMREAFVKKFLSVI